MKKGDKYIIEVAEVHTHYDDNGKAYPIARIKGFSALTFDQKGLDMLEKYEPNNVKEKTYLNCRFVVAKTETATLKVGKIYEVVDGHFDVGNMSFPVDRALITSQDLIDYFGKNGSICGNYNRNAPTEIVIIKEQKHD